MIRDFRPSDVDAKVEILKLNGQYDFPEVDGPEAMKRVMACGAAVFMVYEMDGKVVGVIRGIYDGSRAIILQLSVHPTHQRRGIGRELVEATGRGSSSTGHPPYPRWSSTEACPSGKGLDSRGRRCSSSAIGSEKFARRGLNCWQQQEAYLGLAVPVV